MDWTIRKSDAVRKTKSFNSVGKRKREKFANQFFDSNGPEQEKKTLGNYQKKVKINK